MQIPTELDTSGIEVAAAKVRKQTERVPVKVPVEPVQLDAFSQRVKAQVAKLSAQTEAKIPVTADGERMRRDLATQVAGLQKLLSVKVPLDVGNATAFRAQVLAQVAEVEALAAKIELKPKVTPEAAPGFMARIRAIVKNAEAKAPKIRIKPDVDRGSMSALTTVTGQLQTTAAAVGAKLATWGPALLAAGAGALAIAPAIGVIAPATIGAAAGIGTLALGLKGLGDAFDNAGDPKKAKQFNAAMKTLAPSARQAVRAVLALKPQFTAVQQSVQQALFKGVAPLITAVGTKLAPVLKTSLTQMATGFNGAVKSVAAFVTSSQGITLIRQSLTAASDAMKPLTGAIIPLVRSFLQIGIVAAPALKSVSAGLTGLVKQFAGFIAQAAKSGQLKATISSAVSGVGALLGGIGAVLKPLAAGLSQAGPGVITALAAALRGVGAVIGFLVAQAPKLAPILTAIGAVVAPLAQQLLAGFTAIGPIVSSALTGLSKQGPAVTGVLSAIGGFLTPVIDGFKAFAAAIGPQLQPTLAAVGGFIQGLLPTLKEFASALADKIGTGLREVGQLVATDLLPAIQRILPVIQPVANFLLHILGDAVIGVLNGAINVIKGVIKVISGLLDFITGVFTGNWSLAWDGIKKIFSGIFDAIKGVVEVVWNLGVIKLFKVGLAAIKTLFTELGPALLRLGKGALEGLKSGASAGWSAAFTFIKSIPGLILKGLSNLGRLLVDVGKNVVLGLIRGIKSQAAFVVAAAKELASHIPEPIRKFLHINSPSKLMIELGRFVGEGLAQGLVGSQSQVADAATTLAQKIEDAVTSLTDKRSALAEKIAADKVAVAKASADYAAALAAHAVTASRAIGNAQLRIDAAQAKLARDAGKKIGKGKGAGAAKAGVILADKLSLANAERAYKQQVAKQGESAAKILKAAREKLAAAQKRLVGDTGDLADLNSSFLGLASPATASAIQRLMDSANARLQDIATQREDIAGRLKDAQDQLSQALQVRNDYARGIREALTAFGSVVQAQQQFTVGLTSSRIVTTLKQRLAAIVSYKRDLDALRAGGLSDAALKQIVDAGLEGGAATAAALAKGGQDAITAVNDLTRQIGDQADQLGNAAADQFFGAGVSAAAALVAGLQSQSDALAAQAQVITDTLVNRISQLLGIATNANGTTGAAGKAGGVLYTIGTGIGQSLADGMNASTAIVEAAASRLAAATGASKSAGAATGAIGRGTIGGTNITIGTINNPKPETPSATVTQVARRAVLYTAL